MKVLICLCGIVVLATSAFAGFKLERGTMRVKELAKAKAEAAAQELPITFLYSDEKSSCGLCNYASTEAMKELGKGSVVVYASNADWRHLPRPVQAALRSPQSGKYIPKVVVMSSDVTSVLSIVPYARGKEYDKNLRSARKAISAAGGGSRVVGIGSSSANGSSRTTGTNSKESRTWTDFKGRTVSGALYARSGDSVRIRTDAGKIISIQIKQLSDSDQAFLKGN